MLRREFLELSAAAVAAATAFELAPEAWAQGPAQARLSGGELSLGNRAVAATWRVTPQGLVLASVFTPASPNAAHRGSWPVARLTVAGQAVDSTALTLVGTPRVEPLTAQPGAANYASRLPGRQIVAVLRDPAGRFQLTWRALLRDGSHYIRQQFELKALNADLPVTDIALMDLDWAGAAVRGTVAGSPITTPDDWFFAFEHPLSASTVTDGRAQCHLARPLPLRAGQSVVYSSVIGTAAAGQMRRAFQQYIERERAHPYRTFLHYNSWFDIGYENPYTQADCLQAIHGFGQQLYEKRHVPLNSFLFDDGWDNYENWGFNAGFPDGFTPLRAAAARYKAAPGVWLSPWGGYAQARQKRLAYARAHGYEINKDGLALSGSVYYKLFHKTCLEMVERYGVNQFKFDGTGSVAEVVPGSAFGSDFEAAIALMSDLRAAEPALFINLTTGTYPSPFWLRYADSTWRGGSDTNFAGVGTDRQQWITYRDAATHKGVVLRGPLYPLNSLMLHGIVYASHARRLTNDPGGDFTAGVRAYFGTGTQLQEMYITHQLMTPANWDALAEAALWSRRNASTLIDTHWVGGDPAQLEPYGHAAWSTRNALLTLRNPSDKPQSLTLDPAEAFELPPGAPSRFPMRSPWKQDQWGKPQNPAVVELRAGTKHEFALNPFEVLTLEARA